MKAYHSLAWKELNAQKITFSLIMIAIILSTMMTTAVGQSLGILQALREQQVQALNGYRYATFHNLTNEQKMLVEKDSRLSFVGSNIFLGSSKLKNSSMSLQLREYDARGLSAYPLNSQLSKGRLPQKAGEIALPKDALDYIGFTGNVGDTIKLDLRVSLQQDTETDYKYQSEFTLCGILKSNYLAYSSGIISGIAGQGTAKKLLPEKYQLYSTDFRTENKRSFQKTVNDLATKIGIPAERIQYNWLYLSVLGIDFDKKDDDESKTSGFSYITVTGFMISALVLLAAGLVIYNILKISVSKRIRDFGTLRAIGAQKGQLYCLVAEQLILLCIIGIPIGAVLGMLSSNSITKAATSSFSPEIFMVQNTQELNTLITRNSSGRLLPLIISAGITLVFAFLAAMPAARYAAKVSPITAINGKTSRIKRRNRKSKHIRSFEAFYARLNMRRNSGRTIITVLSLVMSITVFVALQAFSGMLDASINVQKLHLGDYCITNDSVGFKQSVVDNLKIQKEISSVFTLKYSLYMQGKDGNVPIETGIKIKPGETLQIVGVDEQRLKILMPSLAKQDIQDLKDTKACLVKNPVSISYEGIQAETTSINAGDTISIANTKLKVLGICNAVGQQGQGFVNGVQVVVYDSGYNRLTGKDTYSELYPVLKDGADIKSVEQRIEQICSQTAGSRWLSYKNTDKQLEESYGQIKLLAWGLIIFIGLIGLLNIINTTYTNIHTRINEIGMQRAIGMSKASLYKLFLSEGAYYGIIAAVIGAIAGYICTIFIDAAVTEQLTLTALPIIPIFQAAIASIMACLAATCIPLRHIARMSIVDSIETIE